MFHVVLPSRSSRGDGVSHGLANGVLRDGVRSNSVIRIRVYIIRTMSSKQAQVQEQAHADPADSKHARRDQEKEHRRRGRSREREESASESEEDVIDLCDDHDYQVLSAVLETERGRNVAEILAKIQKDVHLLATSVHQLIQLSLAAQQARAAEESEDDDGSEED